jgi:hypothetical protein
VFAIAEGLSKTVLAASLIRVRFQINDVNTSRPPCSVSLEVRCGDDSEDCPALPNSLLKIAIAFDL